MKKQRRYFTKESAHGSSTSYGFCNDTIVLCFNSQKSRQSYIDSQSNLSLEPIKFSEVTKYASNYSLTSNSTSRPNPFRGEFWGIIETDPIDGCIGEVDVCNDDSQYIERLYR